MRWSLIAVPLRLVIDSRRFGIVCIVRRDEFAREQSLKREPLKREQAVSPFFYAILASVDYEVAIKFPNDICVTPVLDTAIGLDVKSYTLPQGSDMAHTVTRQAYSF